MKMRKTIATLLVATLAACALALVGCGSLSTNSSASSSTYTVNDEMETLEVAVMGKDIKIAALIVAQQEGFFEEEGLTLNFQTAANFSDAITGMLNGQLDVLPFGAIPTMTFVGQGTEDL